MKKVICVVLSIVLLCSNVVYADEIIDETGTIENVGDVEVSPLYTNMSAIHSAL